MLIQKMKFKILIKFYFKYNLYLSVKKYFKFFYCTWCRKTPS